MVNEKEQVIKAAAIAAVILISGVFYTVKQQSETGAAKAAVVHTEESVTQEETENTQNVTGQEEQKALCYVYICGAVVSPGVYEVPDIQEFMKLLNWRTVLRRKQMIRY